MSTKSTKSTKSATKSTSRAKTLSRPTRVKAPMAATTLVTMQENARAAFDKARDAHERARAKGASAEKLAVYAQEQSDAWSAFVAIRFERWGAEHAERIIRRGDGTLPSALIEDSKGIRQQVIAYLEAHLRHERSRANPDKDAIAAIAEGLRAARHHLAH